MFEPINDATAVKLPPQMQGMFDLLNEGLPEFIIPDAEKLYVKVIAEFPSHELRDILPISRRIVGQYAKLERNFDADEVIRVAKNHIPELKFYMEAFEQEKAADPLAEALAQIAQYVAADLGIGHL